MNNSESNSRKNDDELNRIHQEIRSNEEFQQLRAHVLRSLPREKRKLLRKNDREYFRERKPSVDLEEKVFSKYKKWAKQFEVEKPNLIKQFFNKLFVRRDIGSSIFVKSGLVVVGVLLGIMIFPMMDLEIDKEHQLLKKEYVLTENPELNHLLVEVGNLKASENNHDFINWVSRLKNALGISEQQMTLEQMQVKAQKGDPVAQNELGLRFVSGEGVDIDSLHAIEWFRKSAEQGYSPAQINLALCYWVGKGVAADPDVALELLRKAAGNGNQSARAMLFILDANDNK